MSVGQTLLKVHYWLSIVCYAIIGSMSIAHIWRNTETILLCQNKSSEEVKPLYQFLMLTEVVDILLMVVVYFGFGAVDAATFKALTIHHTITVAGMTNHFYNGHPDGFALLNSLDIVIPFWYLFKLYPNELTHAIRGTVVAYGRLIIISATVLFLLQHLYCMETNKINTAVTLALLFTFIVKVEIPMFKAATAPYSNPKLE